MSGPSVLHEDRVSLLGDLADLSGYVVEVQLAANPRPDLVRLHRATPALFIADAKATETPGNLETRIRLLGYLAAAAPWRAAGFEVRFAICHGADPACTWVESMRSLASVLGLCVGVPDVRAIDQDAWISSMCIGGPE